MMKIIFLNKFTNKQFELLCEQSYLQYFRTLEHIEILDVSTITEKGE
jgi:hypothetical protein